MVKNVMTRLELMPKSQESLGDYLHRMFGIVLIPVAISGLAHGFYIAILDTLN